MCCNRIYSALLTGSVSGRSQAVKTVSVPTEVVNVLTDLRSYLQDKLEPPVYVSDRRLVKSVALLQVCKFFVLYPSVHSLHPRLSCCADHSRHSQAEKWLHILPQALHV